MKNPTIFIIAGGFYFFGDEVEVEEGYVGLNDCAMFGGFSGGKGLAGVARGDKSSTVTLDRFESGKIMRFPINSCYGIISCIDLYQFKGSLLR